MSNTTFTYRYAYCPLVPFSDIDPLSQLVPHISRDHQVRTSLVIDLVLGQPPYAVLAAPRPSYCFLQFKRAIPLGTYPLLHRHRHRTAIWRGQVRRKLFTFLVSFNFSHVSQSFLVVSALLVTVLELLSLLVLHHFGSSFNVIPSGPVGLAFSLVYQYFRLVPATYHFRVFGVAFSNKSFLYVLASQVNRPPNLSESCADVCFVPVSACIEPAMAKHPSGGTWLFSWGSISVRHCQPQKLPASSLVCLADFALHALTRR